MLGSANEFYGVRGDATLVGHSVTVRCYASLLTASEKYLDSARRSLEWLACSFPSLREQTRRAIEWAESKCAGPFPGSLKESATSDAKSGVYAVPIINDSRMAALWPTTCLLIAYCGMNDDSYGHRARAVADWILTMQDEHGEFSNFRNPDGSLRPLQSGNVNFYASMALWLFNEVYNDGRTRLFTETPPIPI